MLSRSVHGKTSAARMPTNQGSTSNHLGFRPIRHDPREIQLGTATTRAMVVGQSGSRRQRCQTSTNMPVPKAIIEARRAQYRRPIPRGSGSSWRAEACSGVRREIATMPAAVN
jgi:hypothetical protein